MQKSTLHSASADDIIKVDMSVFVQTLFIITFFIIYNVIIQGVGQLCK